MLTVWRLVKAKHAAGAFVGEGARLHAGRWHEQGTPVVYTAESRSLAALEFFFHFEFENAGIDLVTIPAEIPDLRLISEPDELPSGWNSETIPAATQALGTRWLREGRSALLKVPSVLVSGEHNYLLNPKHPDFGKIRIGDPEPFRFDGRMWKRV